MKTLILEIEDDAYQQVMNFISLVPKCHILDFDDDVSSSKNDFVTVTMDFERDVLDAFRAMGADWQHQINIALKQWLQEHSLVHSI